MSLRAHLKLAVLLLLATSRSPCTPSRRPAPRLPQPSRRRLRRRAAVPSHGLVLDPDSAVIPERHGHANTCNRQGADLAPPRRADGTYNFRGVAPGTYSHDGDGMDGFASLRPKQGVSASTSGTEPHRSTPSW